MPLRNSKISLYGLRGDSALKTLEELMLERIQDRIEKEDDQKAYSALLFYIRDKGEQQPLCHTKVSDRLDDLTAYITEASETIQTVITATAQEANLFEKDLQRLRILERVKAVALDMSEAASEAEHVPLETKLSEGDKSLPMADRHLEHSELFLHRLERFRDSFKTAGFDCTALDEHVQRTAAAIHQMEQACKRILEEYTCFEGYEHQPPLQAYPLFLFCKILDICRRSLYAVIHHEWTMLPEDRDLLLSVDVSELNIEPVFPY